MELDYGIAGLRVRMDSFGRTAEQAEPYRISTSGEPDIIISGYADSLQKKQPHLSLDDCEYLTTGASFYGQLLDFDGMLLHASAVVKDGFAYLFSAPCGTGKSTHTALWQQVFGSDAVQMLNDDKPALRKENDVWYAYGTPWSGKTARNTNVKVPLGGICMLARGNENKISPFSGLTAILAILEQTVRPMVGSYRGKLLELLDSLLQSVPVWYLECTPTEDAARVSHNAMTEEAKRRFSR